MMSTLEIDFDLIPYSFAHLFYAAIHSQDVHPILDNETSRNILARHVGVDAFSAFVVSYFGYKARHVYQNLLDAITGKNPKAMPIAYEERLFTYHPEGQRVLLFFTAYQIKNLADTILWNDGILFIVHHILALAAAVSNFTRTYIVCNGWNRNPTTNFADTLLYSLPWKKVGRTSRAFPVLRFVLHGSFGDFHGW